MQKKIIASVIIVILTVIIIGGNVLHCASIGVSPASASLYVGETTIITIDGSGVAGNISASSSNSSIISISSVSSNWIENNQITVNIRANAVGNASINISGKVANLSNSEDESEISRMVNINVKEREVVDNNTNNSTINNSSNNSSSYNSNTSSSGAATTISNTYLKSLQISEEGLTPDFVKTKTNYTLSVGEKVTSIDVNAVAEDPTSKVTISGNNDIKDGDNNIYITVTATNGDKRTYTIVVNKSADPVKSNSYLSNLIISDMVLSPEFSSEILEYNGGTIKTDETTLQIYAYPTNENSKVEIIGNENLILGENIITIKVTSEDETSTKEYKISFIREEGVTQTQALADVDNNNDIGIKSILKDILSVIKQNALLLLMYLLVIVEFIQILYLYKELRKRDTVEVKDESTFSKYNISLDHDKKDEPKYIEDSSSIESEGESKIRTIWDEDKPDFNVTDSKRRRGGNKTEK